MSVLLKPNQFNPISRELTTGIRVDRATATLPQTGDDTLFTITTGRILLVGLVGEVTTVIGSGTTPNLKVKFNPDATGADQDLCANLDVGDAAVGTLLTITGTVGDALVQDLLIGNAMLQDPLLLSEGDIEIETDESVTGSISWSLLYVPWDADAEVADA